MSEISELIEKLRSVRQSTANMCGHVEDWSEHDHLCADSAEEAIDALEAANERIAELEAVIDAAQNVVNTYINKPFCDAASPLEIEDVLKLAEALVKLGKSNE